ncbi:DUF6368 family protein [Sorangium sp. So ce693]|uniref:DUF6368 family protein n=1 Tax=Sorangium sp. So ce693 TaxID=3133318 RepID=UPI003F606B62
MIQPEEASKLGGCEALVDCHDSKAYAPGMAGPVASVLLPAKMSVERVAALRSGISRIANDVRGDDFWLDQRPFILTVGPEYPEAISEILEAGLPEMLGWSPEDVVSFAAMCNDDEDHRLLARLCIDLAEAEGGVIDFCGQLAIGPPLDGLRDDKPVRVENPGGVTGVLFATMRSHYGDVAFARSWLRHASFRMVK